MADGEIIAMPLGTATFASTAAVTPEQSGPTIATMPSLVTSRSAAAVAAPESMQVASPRTGVTAVPPPRKAPESATSDIASSAPPAIAGVSDSMGPVKLSSTPSFASPSCADAALASASADETVRASTVLFIMSVLLPVW